MSYQEDPMRTTVKPVHQWTTMDGKSARKSNIEKWLFGVVLLWAAVILVLGFLGQSANRSNLGGYVA